MHLVVLTAATLLACPRPAHASPTPTLTPATPPPPVVEAERVQVPTEDKLTLVGTFWLPKSKKIAPGAILIHDAGGDRKALDDYAARLVKLGFAVLSVDLRGHGESRTDDLDWATLDEEGRERLWSFATRDVEACTDFLRGQKNVHSSSYVLLGYQSGTTLVTRHAVSDENVRALALLGPPGEDSPKMFSFHLSKDIESLGGLPTFISVPKAARVAAERIVEAGHNASGLDFIQLSVFKGEDADVLSDKKEASQIARWLKEQAFPKRGGR